MDRTLTIQQLLEKHTEYNRETHVFFIGYVSAFDLVSRNKL
jgi:hypothetical protein